MYEVGQEPGLLEFTSMIVAAHVSKNAIAATELPGLIVVVHRALAEVIKEKSPAKPVPAVPINQSVTPDYILCIEDGLKFQSLTRHLKAEHDMTQNEYRIRWGLPLSYPFVAPNYGDTRRKIAKAMGFGTHERGGTTSPKTSGA